MRYIEALNEWDGQGRSLFLGGGISNCGDWQQEMVRLLSGTSLVILNPRRANFPMGDLKAGEEQIKWEHKYLSKTRRSFGSFGCLFWFAPETLCPITLFELGTFVCGQVPLFVGADPNYARKFDIDIQMNLYRPDVQVQSSLEGLAEQVKQWEQWFLQKN